MRRRNRSQAKKNKVKIPSDKFLGLGKRIWGIVAVISSALIGAYSSQEEYNHRNSEVHEQLFLYTEKLEILQMNPEQNIKDLELDPIYGKISSILLNKPLISQIFYRNDEQLLNYGLSCLIGNTNRLRLVDDRKTRISLISENIRIAYFMEKTTHRKNIFSTENSIKIFKKLSEQDKKDCQKISRLEFPKEILKMLKLKQLN